MIYDSIIIGGSAAGASAGIYLARRKLPMLMISEDFGGEVATSGEIWNYPGFVETDGIALSEKFREHLKANGVEPELGVRVDRVVKTEEADGHFDIFARKSGKEILYQAKTVIIATGVHPRHLNLPGEDEFRGKGVTYCTTCDGPLFKNKKVVTIGGGNSALESALMLSAIASHVTLININSMFKGEQVLIDKVTAQSNIEILYEAQTKAIEGSQFVERVVYTHKPSGEERRVDTQGVFIHVGLIPNSSIVSEQVIKNRFQEIEVNSRCETNIPGLYAAGDVTNVPYKQIAIATGQGVLAALSAVDYVNKLGAQ
ncbi:MAG: FAD-dependent oxidoreductase [Candidatus Kerfeldbacteria bacterium]|nr:FAD-dependent oxidoreductase [Candidatus Kerfeldbacteria bacterium]